MGIMIEINCIGCEDCIQCGNDKYYIAECDYCGDVMRSDKKFVKYGRKIICPECLLERMLEDEEVSITEDDKYLFNMKVYDSDYAIYEAITEDMEEIEI